MLDRVEFRQQRLGPLQQCRPGVGQAERAGGALDQPGADLGFQRGNAARHAGLRQSQLASRRRKAAQPGDAGEEAQGAQVIHVESGWMKAILNR